MLRGMVLACSIVIGSNRARCPILVVNPVWETFMTRQ